MRIAVAADHRGYPLKGTVIDALRADGHEVLDLGTASTAPVDYPDYARVVGVAVRDGAVDLGVLLCGSGAGVSIAANKIRGVRAALAHDLLIARQAREDDDANVLCLGATVVDRDSALALVREFVGARFSHAERHERRLAKVLALERGDPPPLDLALLRPAAPRHPSSLDAPEARTALHRLERAHAAVRLWNKDPALWSDDASVQTAIRARLGWLDVGRVRGTVAELETFADGVRRDGIAEVILLGMGGSTLAAEVFGSAFGPRPGSPRLTVLDTTDPNAIRRVRERLDLERSLFLVSSKSGTTTETVTLYRYFDNETRARTAKSGAYFVAITDPGTPLERLAATEGFRRTFLNDPDIGGRFSALSFFGLVPATLLGLDVHRLLDRAESMARACAAEEPVDRNPGLRLGAALAGFAAAGRDKVTLLVSESIRSFGAWLEQLLTESTGKQGTGLVVVRDEPAAPAASYGIDRLFVGVTLGDDSDVDAALDEIAAAGPPVIRLALRDREDLGAEFFRWEIATAAAGALLRVNPFDEPNVAQAKAATQAALATYRDSGRLPEWPMDDVDDVARVLGAAGPPDYVAFLAYLSEEPRTAAALAALRRLVGSRTGCATTLGFGPRYLHSAGQLHKDGPPTVIPVLLTASDGADLPIPGESYGFATLRMAQALGDLATLRGAQRRACWVVLEGDPVEAIERLTATLAQRLGPPRVPADFAGRQARSGAA
jgi:RpiB/LacA/LacB family sugar-phosphate isomerase